MAVVQMVSLTQRDCHGNTARPLLVFLRGVAVFVIAGYVSWTVSRIILFGSMGIMPVVAEFIFLLAIFLPAGLVVSAIGCLFCAWTNCSRLAIGTALSGAVFGGTTHLMQPISDIIIPVQPFNTLAMFATAFFACCFVHPLIALPFLSRRVIALYYVAPATLFVCSVGLYLYRNVTPGAAYSMHAEAKPVSAVNLLTGTSDHLTFEGKMTIVEFWSTTCAPCQDSMQALNAIAALNVEDCKGKLQVITVSLDQDKQVAREHLKTRRWTESQAVIDSPLANDNSPLLQFALARRFGVESIPHCLLIDSRGQIVFRGNPMYLDLDVVIRQIHK